MFPLTPGVTDDRGHYRVSGLAAGEYRVKATLLINSHMTFSRGKLIALTQGGALPLYVYAPAAFHKVDAKPVTLTIGEERTDQDITYNLNGLHAVTGRVTSTEDHHVIATGNATLVDTNDKSFRRSAGLESDGSFSISFVPSGNYTLQVSGEDLATDPDGQKVQVFERKTLRNYESGKRQLIVTDDDLTGQNIELTPVKSSQGRGQNGSDD